RRKHLAIVAQIAEFRESQQETTCGSATQAGQFRCIAGRQRWPRKRKEPQNFKAARQSCDIIRWFDTRPGDCGLTCRAFRLFHACLHGNRTSISSVAGQMCPNIVLGSLYRSKSSLRICIEIGLVRRIDIFVQLCEKMKASLYQWPASLYRKGDVLWNCSRSPGSSRVLAVS